MNKTILKRSRSMSIHVGLPFCLLNNMVDTIMYLVNKSLSTAFDEGIAEEAWKGINMKYYFLRVFGCEAYAHIDKENRKKLYAKYQKYYFIRYGFDGL